MKKILVCIALCLLTFNLRLSTALGQAPTTTQLASFFSVANQSPTGTTLNTLAKLTGAPATAIIAATTDNKNGVVIGVVVSGAGTTGSATIATAGMAPCVFSGATTAGDFVTVSTVTAGNCVDNGAVLPSDGSQIIGRVLSTNAAAGTYNILLNPSLPSNGVWNGASIPVGSGGLGISSGTSGGILGFTAAGTIASSPLLALNGVVLGGGAGATPTATAAGAANSVLNVPAGGGAPVFTSVAPTDGTYIVPQGACGINATTGALAAAGAVAGTNPGPFRVGANNYVLQAVTTAAANALTLDCDITPPSRLTAGKGIAINNVQLFYGVQTTALTSITAPTLSTNTYPATGAAAGDTVAAAGGVLTVTPAVLQLALTTSGQCYSENISLGTALAINTDLQRVVLEQIFNQTAVAATQLQICGVIVHYTNTIL